MHRRHQAAACARKMPIQTQAIIGGGSWGAAIASQLQTAGHKARLLVRNQSTADMLAEGHIRQLPDSQLSQPLMATTDPAFLSGVDNIYVVVPLSAHADALSHIKAHARPGTPVILASKGLMPDMIKGGLFLPEWLAETAAAFPSIMLSGPSFADEVIAGKPAALVAASDDAELASAIAAHFIGSNCRVYSGPDPLGVAIGGAVKNVIAIAAGIASGLNLGDNARAALVTRGLAEMQRLAASLGAQAHTLSGLSGMGDLMLSCAGPHSRNMALGLALGSGTTPSHRLSEGSNSTASLVRRAEYEMIDMPVCKAVDQILNQGQDLQKTISQLLSRQVGAE